MPALDLDPRSYALNRDEIELYQGVRVAVSATEGGSRAPATVGLRVSFSNPPDRRLQPSACVVPGWPPSTSYFERYVKLGGPCPAPIALIYLSSTLHSRLLACAERARVALLERAGRSPEPI